MTWIVERYETPDARSINRIAGAAESIYWLLHRVILIFEGEMHDFLKTARGRAP
jgi:hypothetical protein